MRLPYSAVSTRRTDTAFRKTSSSASSVQLLKKKRRRRLSPSSEQLRELDRQPSRHRERRKLNESR
jgi:hypothetical protein